MKKTLLCTGAALAIAFAAPTLTLAFGKQDLSALRQSIVEAQLAMRASAADHRAVEETYRSATEKAAQCKSGPWARAYTGVLSDLENYRRTAEGARRAIARQRTELEGTRQALAEEERTLGARHGAVTAGYWPAYEKIAVRLQTEYLKPMTESVIPGQERYVAIIKLSSTVLNEYGGDCQMPVEKAAMAISLEKVAPLMKELAGKVENLARTAPTS
ncbi:MAG: hypothetical protein FJX65_00150 [Alphaproteobacteria bacterium]|nr:hypothetical protein [Alphaproteobacteria bacterium]